MEKRENRRQERCTAVVLAAGAGKRMQAGVAKQYLLLDEKPVLWYALHAFQESPVIHEIVLVVGQGEIPYCRKEIVEKYHFDKVSGVIEGGAERYLSVWNALREIEIEEEHYIFIHDGARPFVSRELILLALETVKREGACVAGMPVKDTIKIVDENDFALTTPDRSRLWAVQTPQVFAAPLIYQAYQRMIDKLQKENFVVTDDAMVVETMLGKKVKLIPGGYENIKLTTPEDLIIAEAFLRQKRG